MKKVLKSANRAKEGVDALMDFLVEDEDGVQQISDQKMAFVVLNRLLTERSFLTPAEMLMRVLQAPEGFRAKLLIELTAYMDNSQNPELRKEFGDAVRQVACEEYEERNLEKITLPIVLRAIGTNRGSIIN